MQQASPHRVALMIASLLVPACLPAAAQQPPAPPPVNTVSPSPQSAADQRISALQTQIQITDVQLPQWNAFAQAMRDNATSSDTLFRQRVSSAPSMNALDNMKSYAQVARAYADNTAALADAFGVLYGVLSDQQKQTIDTIFRQQSAQTAATQPKAATQPFRR